MIQIFEDFWREDCIAMVGISFDDESVVQILPVGRDNPHEHTFDDGDEATAARDEIVSKMKKWMATVAGHEG